MTTRNYSPVYALAAAVLMAGVAITGTSTVSHARSKLIDTMSTAPSKKSVTKLPAVQNSGPTVYVPHRLKQPVVANPGLRRFKSELIAPMYRPSGKSK